MKQPIYTIVVDVSNCAKNADLGSCPDVVIFRGVWGDKRENGNRIKTYRHMSRRSLVRAQRAQMALLDRVYR